MASISLLDKRKGKENATSLQTMSNNQLLPNVTESRASGIVLSHGNFTKRRWPRAGLAGVTPTQPEAKAHSLAASACVCHTGRFT